MTPRRAGRAARQDSARSISPGTTWEYSLATDVLGRVVEAASGKRLADFLDERLFKPLEDERHGFLVPAGEDRPPGRALREGPATGPAEQADRRVEGSRATIRAAPAGSRPRPTICASRRCCSTAASSTASASCRAPTMQLMTSDHLARASPSRRRPAALLGRRLHFGLGFAVRPADGIAGVPGSAGDFNCGRLCGHVLLGRPQGAARRRLHGAIRRAPCASTTASCSSSSSIRRSWTELPAAPSGAASPRLDAALRKLGEDSPLTTRRIVTARTRSPPDVPPAPAD